MHVNMEQSGNNLASFTTWHCIYQRAGPHSEFVPSMSPWGVSYNTDLPACWPQRGVFSQWIGPGSTSLLVTHTPVGPLQECAGWRYTLFRQGTLWGREGTFAFIMEVRVFGMVWKTGLSLQLLTVRVEHLWEESHLGGAEGVVCGKDQLCDKYTILKWGILWPTGEGVCVVLISSLQRLFQSQKEEL